MTSDAKELLETKYGGRFGKALRKDFLFEEGFLNLNHGEFRLDHFGVHKRGLFKRGACLWSGIGTFFLNGLYQRTVPNLFPYCHLSFHTHHLPSTPILPAPFFTINRHFHATSTLSSVS